MSLRARLLAASLALLTAGLLVADVATFSALRSFLYDRVDAQLDAATSSMERAVVTVNRAELVAGLQLLTEAAPGVFVQIREPTGTAVQTIVGADRSSGPQLANTIEIPPLEQRPGRSPRRGTRYFTAAPVDSSGPRYRVAVSSLPDGYGLIVALPLRETAATLSRLVAIEALVTVGVIAMAAGLGLWLVRLGLRPLADIEGTAAAITAGDLSQRVEREDERTEVGRLGKAINTMLDAIDVAFAERRASEEAARRSEEVARASEEVARASEQRLRRFVADASHELRTPVAAVRAYAELYRMGADQHPEDLARLLSRIEEEADRSGVLVDDLLLLTRLDEGRPLESAPVDLGAVAADAVAAARALEPDRPIGLDVVGSVEVLGDRDRLRQVVDNLLANVRAHTPADSPADVRVRSDGARAVVEVADRGPGMGPEALSHVFERFYRADPSRARDRGGAGLGLSIVTAIAGAHGGRATALAREGGGSVFCVELPLLDGSDPPS